jgi:hypothetical protein
VVRRCRVRGEQAVNERVHLGGSGGVEPRQREGHRGGTPEQRIPSTVGMPSRQRAHTLSDYLSLHCSCETEWTVPLGVSSNIALYAPHARIHGRCTCAQLHSHAGRTLVYPSAVWGRETGLESKSRVRVSTPSAPPSRLYSSGSE